ncbi:Flp family type IVb pilin [Qipengyuania sp. RANM35]|uniref:Flp family type IVb pilin n=1 Tax=Qipengyuania sp. RANM35 TaxID=3068635 RepID=UPI0034DADD3A
MTNFIKNFVADESGASAAEYALILVMVGIAIILGARFLATSISGAMSTAGTCITSSRTVASGGVCG